MAATAFGTAREREHACAGVQQELAARGVDYEVVRHDPSPTAVAEAHSCGVPLRRVVKTVALHSGGRLVAVALPASERINIQRVRQLLGDPDAELATEAEIAHELRALEPGALPPFGAPAPPLVLVDRRVLSSKWVLAGGGDHRHSLRVSPLDIVRLSHARVVDIAQS